MASNEKGKSLMEIELFPQQKAKKGNGKAQDPMEIDLKPAKDVIKSISNVVKSVIPTQENRAKFVKEKQHRLERKLKAMREIRTRRAKIKALESEINELKGGGKDAKEKDI